MSQFAKFCYEFGMLSHTPRSGFVFLGSGEQSVAEHTCRTLGIAFLLARLVEEPVDELRLMRLLLFHDLPETRSGDLNYMNQKYVQVNWDRLLGEMEAELPFGQEMVAYVREFEERATPEARVARDADQLELLVSLRELVDSGNPRAADWIPSVRARIQTPAGQRLAEELLQTHCDEWWFHHKKDRHWVQGNTGSGGAEEQG
jgi:putative hydrolase of HD superfamily